MAEQKSRGRCTGKRASSSSQRRGRRGHGRPATEVRALSGTQESCHRSARMARSLDRCRETLSGRGSRHSAKLIPSVRLRGLSSVQSNRICIPRICFNQGYRKPKQRRRHCVAHILGGVRPIRSGRVLQRSTPVLVPFLLRGQVRLPVVLHESGAVERSPNAISPRRSTTLPKASRSRGQRLEPPQQQSSGRSSRSNQGRQTKLESPAEGQGQMKQSSSPMVVERVRTEDSQPTDASADTLVENQPRSSSPGKSSGSPLRTTSGNSQPYSPAIPSPTSRASGSASGSQLPNKPRGHSSRRNSNANRSQQRTRLSNTSPRSSQPGTQRNSITTQTTPMVQSPSGTTVSVQPTSKAPNEPGDSVPKPCRQHHKHRDKPPNSNGCLTVPQLPAPCHSESSREYLSESTTEITCNWPHYRHGLHCACHCWFLKHLA